MRLRIGIVHAFVKPGMRSAASSSSTSFSGVIPDRHSPRGLSAIVVSIIDSGAGSVAESARPTFPNTCRTSGKVRMTRSVCYRISRASVIDTPGSVVGM